MFSQLFVCPQRRGGSASRGGLHRGAGRVCIQGGLHQSGLHSRGICIQEGVRIQAVCIGEGGLHPGGSGQTPSSDTTGYSQRAGGTHPTGMYSCHICKYISVMTLFTFCEQNYKIHTANKMTGNNVIDNLRQVLYLKSFGSHPEVHKC